MAVFAFVNASTGRSAARSLLNLRSDALINPPLEPVSDKKFFKADYPDDRRAPQFHKFGYPYPTVQDSDEYDKDYVEDKNNDGGYWKAQMTYDALKNILIKEKDELAAALRKEIKEKNDLEAARKRELDAEHEAEHAEDMASAAEKKARDADKKIWVEPVAEKVEAEITDLEECKKQLAAAKKKLNALLEEKKRAEATKVETEKNETAAELAEEAAEKAEEASEKGVDAADKEHEAVFKTYQEELADVKQAEIDLEAAAKDVRKYRRAPHVDDNGGVYEAKSAKGGSCHASGLLPTMLALGIALMQAWAR